ncbi:MAG: hydantoinase/oxoprolinase [Rhodospirillales bacterium]|nr:hydantoinase/oxoprolinase [Rhodospirillales bacterium]
MPRADRHAAASDIIGWDLGGAHLKAARVDAAGAAQKVVQLPCRLWMGIGELDRAIDTALQQLGPCQRHAVTMTGELADLFADRRAGVASLTATLRRKLRGASMLVYAGPKGLVVPADATRLYDSVASANFLASAEAVAASVPDALFVDLGSTTADLIPIRDGMPRPRGLTDFERLASDELVYTGVARTPVMAVAQQVPVGGAWRSVMAEYFATMADVHRLAGDLPRGADLMPTADNRGRSPADSARRLARMVGADADAHPRAAWVALARFLSARQLAQLERAARRVLAEGAIGADAPVIGAGVGRFLVKRLAALLGRPYRDAGTIFSTTGLREGVARCLPAVAVAVLAARRKAWRTASSRTGSSASVRPRAQSAPRKPR